MARGMSVRVVVADDHPVFLDGLARIVSRAAELTLVATARAWERCAPR